MAAPRLISDVKQWAILLVEYLDRKDSEAATSTAVVKLQHQVGTEKAVEDGVLMFDPALGKVVVSVSGAWVPVH